MKKIFTLILFACPFLAISQPLRLSPNTVLPTTASVPSPITAPVKPTEPTYGQLPHPDLPTARLTDQKQEDYNKFKAENDAVNAKNTKLKEDFAKAMNTYYEEKAKYDNQPKVITIGGTTTGGNDNNSVITGGTTTDGTTIDFSSKSITKGGTVVGGITEGGTHIPGTITGGKTTGGTVVGGTTTYDAWVMSTNFTIPLVRVNFLVNKPQNATNSKASASFLNAAGAGVTFSKGRLDVTKDNTNKQTAIDFYNTFGFQVGFLFASNSTAGSSASQTSTSSSTTTPSSTVFAIMAGLSVLNFSLDGGYELGSLASGQRRFFLAIAYAIPVSTLVDGGYKVLGINKLSKKYNNL